MSTPARSSADDTDGTDKVDMPRSSNAEDENAGLLHSHDHYENRRTIQRLPRSTWLIRILAISNSMTIATLLFLLIYYLPALTQQEYSTAVVYPPQPKWFPPQVPVTKILQGDQLYGQPPNAESIKAWNDLLPAGRGWVTIQNETALPDLPGLNQSLPEHQAFPSVFHQLHCLYSTMDAYYTLLDLLPGGNDNEGHKSSEKREQPTDPGWTTEHLNHCWDYLRQTIMCNADVTLEWRKYNEQVGTGWGYQHQCKDWDAIIAWAERYRHTNNWGILRGGGERIPLHHDGSEQGSVV
ncbi:Oxidase ustYa [Paramyrothecium foliicola]|nr:Oxidase ustYa [Paramyrothecium foliicola]